jgi:hypothetical protein
MVKGRDERRTSKTLEGDEKYDTEFWSGKSVGMGTDVSIVFFTVEGLWTGLSTATNRQVP